MTAAAAYPMPSGVDPVIGKISELAVLRALEAAGKRGRLPRALLAELKPIPTHEIHTRVHLADNEDECDRLLSGVWDHLCMVLPEVDGLVECLDDYVRDLIMTGDDYHVLDLYERLAELDT